MKVLTYSKHGAEWSTSKGDQARDKLKKMNYSEYTVTVGTDAGYYGSHCSDEDARKISAAIGKLIEGEFPGINISFNETSKPVHGPDATVCEEIRGWVEDNWMAAL